VAPLLLSVALPLVALAPLLFALPTLLLDAAPVAHHVVLQLLSPLPELGVAVVASFQEVHEFQEFTVDGLVLLIQHTLQLAHGVKVGAPVDLGDGGACLPRTSSASNAVQLVVQVLRHVEVHNQVHVGEVQPPRGHVGSNEHADEALGELGDYLLPRDLGLVRVQHPGRHVVGAQEGLQVVAGKFAVAEDHGLVVLQVLGTQ